MHYLIVKKKNKYFLLDILSFELGSCTNSNCSVIRINEKTNKVCEIYSYEVIDDYFCDIGAVTHYERGRNYLGKLIYSSDNIEEIAIKFNELRN